jgi:hypothetical protein
MIPYGVTKPVPNDDSSARSGAVNPSNFSTGFARPAGRAGFTRGYIPKPPLGA